jgi:hypothetical protein
MSVNQLFYRQSSAPVCYDPRRQRQPLVLLAIALVVVTAITMAVVIIGRLGRRLVVRLTWLTVAGARRHRPKMEGERQTRQR